MHSTLKIMTANTPKKTTTRKPRATKPKVKAPAKKTVEKPIELPTNPFVFEILELVSSQRTAAKKIEVLKKYEDNSVKSVLIWNFDLDSTKKGGGPPWRKRMPRLPIWPT